MGRAPTSPPPQERVYVQVPTNVTSRSATKKFDHYELTHFALGGHPIGITVSERKLHVAGEDLSVEEWLRITDRVKTALEHEGLVDRPEKFENAAPWEGRSSTFLSRNVMQIHEQQGGYLKRAPWWLRPFFRSVVTREEYRGQD